MYVFTICLYSHYHFNLNNNMKKFIIKETVLVSSSRTSLEITTTENKKFCSLFCNGGAFKSFRYWIESSAEEIDQLFKKLTSEQREELSLWGERNNIVTKKKIAEILNNNKRI